MGSPVRWSPWALSVLLCFFARQCQQFREVAASGDVCQHPAEIQELQEKDQCGHVEDVSNSLNPFFECKQRMQKKLVSTCAETKIRKAGKMYYCRQGSSANCCYYNHSCLESWDDFNQGILRLPILFLTKTKESLKEIQDSGYEKCHAIKGYDASECAKDCSKAANGEFAKQCAQKGGFFKCCVRRDKIDCHECRFCCSLLLCAMNTTEGVQNYGKTRLEAKDQDNILSAIEMFNLKRPMYKSRDSRCLKPIKSQNPEDWGHYDHEEFKKATNKKQLDNVPIISFDVNFLNFEDPAVLERFTANKDYAKVWQETFGVDYATKLGLPRKKTETEHAAPENDQSRMPKYCLQSEYSDFGRECRRTGGLFKCCYTGYNISVYENLHHQLDEQRLLRTTKLGKRLCSDTYGRQDCAVYTATHICTRKDPLTGKIHSEFLTPPKSRFEIGGYPSDNPEWSGMRTNLCYVYNSCQNEGHVIDHDSYERAFNKRTFCKSLLITLASRKANASQALLKHVKERCKKQEISTMFLCEDDALLADEKARAATTYFREAVTRFKKFAELEDLEKSLRKAEELRKVEEGESQSEGHRSTLPPPTRKSKKKSG